MAKSAKTPIELRQDAFNAASSAILHKGKMDGFTKKFTAACLKLAAMGTATAKAEGETLGKELSALTGGASYASNAKRILAATPAAARKALEACLDEGGTGFPAPAGLFKKFKDEFPPLTDSGRRASATPNSAAANDGVNLSTPAGWRAACAALLATVQGQKGWELDDIQAVRDSAQRIIAMVDRYTK